MVQVSRLEGAARLGTAHERLFELLLPHFVQARELCHRFDLAGQRRPPLSGALDRLPMAVFFVDTRGAVKETNRAADRLLAAADGIRFEDGVLRADDPKQDGALARAIGEAARTGAGQGLQAGGALRLERASGRRPLELVVAPIHRAALDDERPGSAVVFAVDPEQERPPAESVLRALYGLTPAESRLAVELASGLSLAESAESLQVSVHTVRQQLKMIFQKTGANRQASLLRLLSQGPASLAGPEE